MNSRWLLETALGEISIAEHRLHRHCCQTPRTQYHTHHQGTRRTTGPASLEDWTGKSFADSGHHLCPHSDWLHSNRSSSQMPLPKCQNVHKVYLPLSFYSFHCYLFYNYLLWGYLFHHYLFCYYSSRLHLFCYKQTEDLTCAGCPQCYVDQKPGFLRLRVFLPTPGLTWWRNFF